MVPERRQVRHEVPFRWKNKYFPEGWRKFETNSPYIYQFRLLFCDRESQNFERQVQTKSPHTREAIRLHKPKAPLCKGGWQRS